MKKMFILVIVVLAATAASGQADKIIVPLRFDRYYTLEQVYEAARAANTAFPEMTKLEEVGRSEEGRPLYALTINNPKTGLALSKPGIYLDGNIHGNEIQGGEICLYLLDYLLGNYGKNKDVTELIDKKVFYIVPVVNPDGRWHFFNDANTPSSNRSVRIPLDDDKDGLIDEDPPEDLDGDGSITTMRKKDLFGEYKTDPEDARLMVRVKPGETGEWTTLGGEGTDNDGDGLINEDAEGYVDGNRQWGFDWRRITSSAARGSIPSRRSA